VAVAWDKELVAVDLREGEVIIHEESGAGGKKTEWTPIRALSWFISSVGSGLSKFLCVCVAC
jgi:hypothetical protein